MKAQYLLTGKVTDIQKSPIPGASVVFTQKDSICGMSLTDKYGKWTVAEFDKGEYQMAITMIGYTPIVEKVFVSKDLNMDFMLLEEMSGELGEVTVNANRSNIVKTNSRGSTFYLSSKAQKAMNIYTALSEIPMLSVNEMEHTISSASGSKVIILLNGVPRGNAMESINPQDILSVEVMDTPSARYLAEGFTQVVNIKTRRKVQKYRLLNLSTDHNPGLYYGTINGGYEQGNNRHSFYINGKMFYFNNNHYEQTEEQRTNTTYKTKNLRGKSDYYSYDVTLGNDWVMNDKNYMSFNGTLRAIPTNGVENGKGILENEFLTTEYIVRNRTKTNSWVNVYNLFHRHTFNRNAILENSLNFTYNWNDDCSERNEQGTDYLYQGINRNKTNFFKGDYTVVFSMTFSKSMLEIGNRLLYEQMDLEQPSSMIDLNFSHKRWKEYLYADFTYNVKPVSFSASLGWDLSFNKVEDRKNNYSHLKYNVSLNTKLEKNGGVTLFTRGYTVDPSSSYLNPYDTSADSLLVVRGNHALRPYYYKEVGISANYSYGKFYIWPQFIYSHYSDMIAPIGYYTDENIYVSTYENTEKEENLSARMYIRYSFGKWGEISYRGSYNRRFFYTGVKNWFGHRISWNFGYKKASLYGHAEILPPTYTAVKQSKSSLETLTTLNWSLNHCLSLRASLRYFIKPKTSQSWHLQKNYYSYFCREFDERYNMILLGLSYRWQNDVKARKTKKLNVNSNRVNLLSE